MFQIILKSVRNVINLPLIQPQTRQLSSIFVNIDSEKLWEGVCGPKGSAKKRARGKRRIVRPRIDLNRGQYIGFGKAGIVWPGLKPGSKDMNKITVVEDNDYMERLIEFRNKSSVKTKRAKLAPIERGYSGNKMGGQSLGVPHPDYPNFDSRILELKVVATMTGTKGRFRRFSAIVASGDGQGTVGIGVAKGTKMRSALFSARGRSMLNLNTFDLKEDRTIWHAGMTQVHKNTIYAFPRNEGQGLTCHVMLRMVCRLIGIKDLYAKVEGNTKNYKAIIVCFLRLLQEQKSYQQIADSTGLNVVEFSEDFNNYPRVLASPSGEASLMISNKNDSVDSSEFARWETEKAPRTIIQQQNVRKMQKKLRPKDNSIFLNDLVDEVDHNEPEDFNRLLSEGERDLDTLLIWKGRIPKIKKNETPAYWDHPGVLRAKELRRKYINQHEAAMERTISSELDRIIAEE